MESPSTQLSVYQQLEALVLPHLTENQADLFLHDREAIVYDNPAGTPFLLCYGRWGTQLVMLGPPRAEWFFTDKELGFLSPGKSQPNNLTLDEQLRRKLNGYRGKIDFYGDNLLGCIYFDGREFHRRTVAEARELVEKWYTETLTHFTQEELQGTTYNQ